MLKFGITPVEGENIKKIFNPEKGLKNFTDFRFSDLIMQVIEHGFKHCEISLDLFQVLPVQINDEEKQKIKNIKKEFDISFSAHFPIWSVELASPNKFIREASVQSCLDAYNKVKFLEPDIDVFVIHPTGAFCSEILRFDMDPKAQKFLLNLLTNYALQSLRKIIQKTNINIYKIAIENIEFPFENTIDIINKVKGTNLCIDTAHTLGGFSGNIDLVEITKKYLDITSEIHLQDYSARKFAPDHVALGKGTHFPIKFLQIINKNNFKGPIVFELDLTQAIESLEFIKKHTPEIEVPYIKK
jgi:sugar phosphate isomerase/epimerase